MKEAFAAVLTGLHSLGSDEIRERPVDRLGALGMIQRQRAEQSNRGKRVDREAALSALGVDLMRFKNANVAAAKLDAQDQLAGVLAWKTWGLTLTGRERSRVAAWAVQEWAIDMCPACKGARMVQSHEDVEGRQPMKHCTPCGGSGRRYYSDPERVAALGAAYTEAMEKAHEIIARAEALAVERGKALLERWTR